MYPDCILFIINPRECRHSYLCQYESWFNYHYLLCWRRQWHPTPVLLPGKSNGWRSLIGCRTWGHEESDTTERLHFHFSLSCIGEGNGNPLQCSCLENPRDGGAWWAAVYGVAQSWTRLKRLSSSSSSSNVLCSKSENRHYIYLDEKHLKIVPNSSPLAMDVLWPLGVTEGFSMQARRKSPSQSSWK